MNARPGLFDLFVQQGDKFVLTINFKDAAGAAINYSALTFTAQFRPTHASGDVDKVTFGIDATGSATGVVIISLTKTQTAALPLSGVWDIQGATAGGDPTTFLTGAVTVGAEVTR